MYPEYNKINSEIVLKVHAISKKFCRDFKKSLMYGLFDIFNDLIPVANSTHLRKSEFWALKNVSFELKQGECLGLIGSNGSGKTSLLRIINNLYKPDTGYVEANGKIGALIALGTGFNPLLTGRENIYINGAILGIKNKAIREKEDEIIKFSEIEKFIDSPIRSYSSGMIVRLGFSIASILRPKILVLDEVLAVGDISFQNKCLAQINKIKKSGTSTILVSHNMHHIYQYTDRCIWLEEGQIKHEGKTQKVCHEYIKYMDERIKSNLNKDFIHYNSSIYGNIIPVNEDVKEYSISVTQKGKEFKKVKNKKIPINIAFRIKTKTNCQIEITFNIYEFEGLKVGVFNNKRDNFNAITKNNLTEIILNVDISQLQGKKYILVVVVMDGGKFLLRDKIIELDLTCCEIKDREAVIDLPRTWINSNNKRV